jgi:PTH1 family peptidyl-tRNA hydrolase
MEGLMGESGSGEGKILLLKPQTFMNLSGRCVSKVLQFYKIEATQILVLCDDKDLPLGKLRIRASGSHGGNNGLRSIQDHIGLDYPRLKVGIGEPKRGDAAAHVLGRFSGSERTEMEKALDIGAMAVETWLAEGLTACMNRFNAGPDKGSAGRS